MSTAATTRPSVLAPTVEHRTETRRDGSSITILVDTRTGRAARLDEREWALLDGADDADQVAPQARALLGELAEQGLLRTQEDNDEAVPAAQATTAQRAANFLRTFDAPWSGADAVVRSAHAAGLRHLFHPTAIVAQAALGVAGLIAFWQVATSGHVLWRAEPWMVPAVLALNLLAIAVHETAHALVRVHHGRRVHRAGFRLHLGTPAFYVDSIESLLLPRRHRFVQALAGPWAEWLVTAAIALVAVALPAGDAADLARRFVVLNLVTVLSNLLPFVGLDGYWVLADLLREPQPGERGRDELSGVIDDITERRLPSLTRVVWAAYGATNAAVAGVLLLLAGAFWYQTFGRTIAVALSSGPIATAALGVAAVLLLRPVMLALRPNLERAVLRIERRWRVPAITALAALPELDGLDHVCLGVLAGRLVRVDRSDTSEGATTTVQGRVIGLAWSDVEWVRAARRDLVHAPGSANGRETRPPGTEGSGSAAQAS